MSLILPSGEKDEVLDFNSGALWVALLFLVPAVILQFALAAQIGPVIPFGAASLVTLLILLLESRRPTYPFRFLQSETPPEWLTEPQRRVLTYLKSPEGLRSRRRLGGALIGLTALATGVPAFLGKVPDWVLYYLRIPPDQFLDAVLVLLSSAMVFQAIATYTALFGWGCLRALCRWDEIQATYEPWPATGTNEIYKAFRVVRKPPAAREAGSSTPVPAQTPPSAGLRPSTPVSGRQVLAVICFMLGAPALFVGATSLPRTLSRGGLTPGSGLAVETALVLAGLVFLWLGGYLWRR